MGTEPAQLHRRSSVVRTVTPFWAATRIAALSSVSSIRPRSAATARASASPSSIWSDSCEKSNFSAAERLVWVKTMPLRVNSESSICIRLFRETSPYTKRTSCLIAGVRTSVLPIVRDEAWPVAMTLSKLHASATMSLRRLLPQGTRQKQRPVLRYHGSAHRAAPEP